MDSGFVFKQKIIVGYEMLMLKIFLVNHEYTDVLALRCVAWEKCHILVVEESLTDYVIFDLFTLYLHYKNKEMS